MKKVGNHLESIFNQKRESKKLRNEMKHLTDQVMDSIREETTEALTAEV